MTSTKTQEWDWRFKLTLAAAVLGLFAFFVMPWLMVVADLIITYIETGDMPRPPPLDTDWTR